MKLGLPSGKDAELKHATVKKRIVDIKGKPVGKVDKNLILDSRQYEVDYYDGHIEILIAYSTG